MPARGETLPRQRILREGAVLKRLRREGYRVGDRCLTLFGAAAAEEEPTRAAFLTPKRLGTAVVRNRLRRRMREIYRRRLEPPATGMTFLWTAKPPATALTFEQLLACMLKLARRHDREFRPHA